MQAYIAPGWKEILENNKLDSFAALWNLPQNWFETPNVRRKGWSGVSVVKLKIADNEIKEVFVKRQSNHICKTWRHPFRGIPTFAREANNLLRFAKILATQNLLYFQAQHAEKEFKSILITEKLVNYTPLDMLLKKKLTQEFKKRIINELASSIKKMHKEGIQHNALYPKHIFVNEEQMDFCFIDLENSKYLFFYKWSFFRDLDTLNRHISGVNEKDKIYFLKKYLGVKYLNKPAKHLWTRLKKRYLKKKR